jgi:hypothetical protein
LTQTLVVGEAQHGLVMAKRRGEWLSGHEQSTIGPAGDASGVLLDLCQALLD